MRRRRTTLQAVWGLALLAALLAPASAALAIPTHACSFRLGFAELAEVIPDVVGACVGDETHAANGDALQVTTGGLLVWRQSDNWTAFTDGFDTWINGPDGIASRPNNQRFEWESDYGLFIPPLAVGGTWANQGVELTVRQVEVGKVGSVPSVTVTYTVTNLTGVRLALSIDHENGVQVVDNLGVRYPLECCVTQPLLQASLEPGESLHRFAQYQGDASRAGVNELTITFVELASIRNARWVAPVLN